MPKVQAHVRTRDGHILRGAASNLTDEEVEALAEGFDNNWSDLVMVRIATEDGFACIPMDNLSTLSFSVVDED